MHQNNINPNALDFFEEEKKEDERTSEGRRGLTPSWTWPDPRRGSGETHSVGFAVSHLSLALVSNLYGDKIFNELTFYLYVLDLNLKTNLKALAVGFGALESS